MTESTALSGLRVLVVDDEALVAMLMEDMLQDLGCEPVGAAARVSQALEMVRDLEFDLAVLDVNLAGESIAPVAEAVLARGAAVVFATGYGEAGVPAAFKGRPTLQKPFGIAEVAAKLKEASGR
jgi:CheY-like chemotaxis protein